MLQPVGKSAPHTMIKFLANLFRGIHFMLGITAPPPGPNDRRFVLAWLLILLAFIAFCATLLHVIPQLYVNSRSAQ
jgi:hypothetical protein